MEKNVSERYQQIQQWLEENVQLYFTPKNVTLHSFEVDWKELSGSFEVLLDNRELPHALNFSVDISGKAEFYLPMYHSPLGAPASYPAIDLCENTSNAILKGLRKAIPKVRGCGKNRETGVEIINGTPIKERIINVEEFEEAKERVNSLNYSITIETNPL